MSATAKKILVVRFSSIGDVVLTTPVLRTLKKQLNAEVHYLTKQTYASIIEPNPYVSKVFAIQKEVGEVLTDLKAEAYDYIIDLHKNLRSTQVKIGLKGKAFSFAKLNFEKWLLTNLKINRLPKVHIVDRYLDAVKPLGVQNDGQGLDFFIPEEAKVNLPPVIGSPIALAVGAAHATKRLPLEKLKELCQLLPVKIALLGGPDDTKTGISLQESFGEKIINYCGQLSILQSASVIQQSICLIAPDTGMMHIASALRKPILSIWGNTVPDFGMYPYYPDGMALNQSFEVRELSCRPCSKIGYKTCPKGHFRCMQEQNISEIAEQVKIINNS